MNKLWSLIVGLALVAGTASLAFSYQATTHTTSSTIRKSGKGSAKPPSTTKVQNTRPKKPTVTGTKVH